MAYYFFSLHKLYRYSGFWVLVILQLNTSAPKLYAQAPYLGGVGDGYALAETAWVQTSRDREQLPDEAVLIYPNPVQSGASVQVRLRTNILEPRLYTLSGKYLPLSAEQSGRHTWIIDTATLFPGVYLLSFVPEAQPYARRGIKLVILPRP